MTLFDLLLILLVLATAVAFIAALVAMVLRRWKAARRLALGVTCAWILYLGVGAIVAVTTPQHIMAIGEDRCFDEMCFAVAGWNRIPETDLAHGGLKPGRVFYMVQVRITNRSRGRAQREVGRNAVLIDQSGHVYEASADGLRQLSPVGAPPYPGLDTEVGPGQSVNTRLVFDLPESVESPGFSLGTSLAINPARLVIADEEHFLHRPTVVPLG